MLSQIQTPAKAAPHRRKQTHMAAPDPHVYVVPEKDRKHCKSFCEIIKTAWMLRGRSFTYSQAYHAIALLLYDRPAEEGDTFYTRQRTDSRIIGSTFETAEEIASWIIAALTYEGMTGIPEPHARHRVHQVEDIVRGFRPRTTNWRQHKHPDRTYR